MTTQENPATQPPPLPTMPIRPPVPRAAEKGRPFALSALIVGCIGILPFLIFLFMAFGYMLNRWSYRSPLIMIVLLIVGLLVHGLAIVSAIVGLSLKAKGIGIFALLINAGILAGSILVFVIAILN